MVCISLVAANAYPHKVVAQGECKATLIVCQNTLVAQWADEVRKFAPRLKTVMHYGNSKKYNALTSGAYDVVVTSPHMKLDGAGTLRMHRLIVDESHLIGGSKAGQYGKVLTKHRAQYTWLVSGTPFEHFGEQHEFLGVSRAIWPSYNPQKKWWHQPLPFKQEILPRLKKLMVRHSKSQRIHGEAALSLPDAMSRAELLDMTPAERALYEVAGCIDGCPYWLLSWLKDRDVSTHPTNDIDIRRSACSHEYGSLLQRLRNKYFKHFDQWPAEVQAAWSGLHPTPNAAIDKSDPAYDGGVPGGLRFHELTKAKFLVQQLGELREKDPSVRIIIFTEHGSTQRNLVGLFASQMHGWQIYEFNQSTAPQRRHKIIREFQADHSATYPAACIATYQTAAVGVTLTAASRVYLFEPCTSPATEAQAAGRIHRLGQTKEIHIVRLVFRDSVEHALAQMHEARAKGEMDGGSKDGRAALRAAFRACHVDAAHSLAGPITKRTLVEGPSFAMQNFECSYQQCSRCKCEVLIDRKKAI